MTGFLVAWAPFLATATLILYLSSQPVLPKPISAPTARGETLRQLIHIVEYSALGFFLYRGLARTRDERASRWSLMLIGFVCGVGFAVADELHQRLVPNRDMSLTDVFVDSIGLALGITLGRAFFALKRRTHSARALRWI